jgi:hypothetical protein
VLAPPHPYSLGRWALKFMYKKLATYTKEYRILNTEYRIHAIQNTVAEKNTDCRMALALLLVISGQKNVLICRAHLFQLSFF